MSCACAKGPLDEGSKDAKSALDPSQRRDVSAVYIYTSVFRGQQCPLVLISLYAWGEVSSYTNLLQGDTRRSGFLREIMKSRTFWQGAEMSVWQADRLLYHNLIHPVRVWEDVFDELATQISKEFLACAWSSHTSGIKIHLEWEDHSLSMTPVALTNDSKVLGGMSGEGNVHNYSGKADPITQSCTTGSSEQGSRDSSQHCLLVTWTKNGQQYPIFQTEEDSLGVIWNAACPRQLTKSFFCKSL